MNVQDLKVWEQLQKKLTWEQLGEFSGKRILEFGCGNGVMGAHYAGQNIVTGIEPDAQVLAENPYENVEQICGDEKVLSRYADGTFDVIFCHNVLEYVKERAEVVREFERLLKKDGLISILKHNRPGRIMQMTVLLNNFEHANELLDGKCGASPQFGEISYYEDEELVKWAPGLRIEKILGMRTFWDLQQNQDIQNDPDWQREMMKLEQRVSDRTEYQSIAFFHHVFLRKSMFYEKYGFIQDALVETKGYPNQKYILHPAGSERCERQKAINKMIHEINSILSDCEPSIYLYGSSVLDDFRLGWSDIDILVLTNRQISETQAQKLVNLRQTMLEKESGNPYYRLFEGGMLTLDAFISKSPDRVVYWGTSGERITDTYMFDSFGMAELIERGILLCGCDVRSWLSAPNLSDLYADIKHHYETIREYVRKTERSLYSFGWMLDIARCLYTLRTGKIIAKTAAAEWALENNLCPVPDVLKTALQVRKAPLEYKNKKQVLDYAESLADPIQRFADVLEDEMCCRLKMEL